MKDVAAHQIVNTTKLLSWSPVTGGARGGGGVGCLLACNTADRLAGLVVKASASRAEDLRSESRLRRDFSGSSHTSDLKIGTPVAALSGAWRYRVGAGTGWPGVSIL